MTAKVLQVLEALDRHCFDRVDSCNSIDSLYVKVFPALTVSKGVVEPLSIDQISQLAKQDEPFVRLLCQWAVSDQRYGEYRAMAVALLLEKRQTDLVSLTESDNAGADDNETEDNSSAAAISFPVFQVDATDILLFPLSLNLYSLILQSFLMKFLDSEAPVLNEPSSGQSNRTVFSSLVHLFYELVKHDVFSHDMYMCTLISRGDLLSVTVAHGGTGGVPSSSGHHLGGPSGSGMSSLTGFKSMNDLRCEMDDSKIDDDLGKLLQHIKEEQQIVMV